MLGSKSRLAIVLSYLKVFQNPSHLEEQYATDSEIAADVIWKASFNNEVTDNVIADLGAGTGILGIGCLLMDAKKVYFVEKDGNAIATLKENIESIKKEYDLKGEYEILNIDMNEFDKKVDLVIENPPFGTRQEHADRDFLVKSFSLAPTIISFHKITSKDFIEKLSADNHFKITHYWEYDFPIKASQLFHKKALHRIKVGVWRLAKVDLNSY